MVAVQVQDGYNQSVWADVEPLSDVGRHVGALMAGLSNLRQVTLHFNNDIEVNIRRKED